MPKLTIYILFLIAILVLVIYGILNVSDPNDDYILSIQPSENIEYPSNLELDRGDYILLEMAEIIEKMDVVVVRIEKLTINAINGIDTLTNEEIKQEIEKSKEELKRFNKQFEILEDELKLFKALKSNELMSA